METRIKTGPSVFCSYYTEWNKDTYPRIEPFSERPFSMPSGSTGGAPVVMGDGFLAGLVQQCDALFEWDGALLTVNAPENTLFVSTVEDEVQRWREYHQALGFQFGQAPFGKLPEYCTWVEQSWLANDKTFNDVLSTLSSELIGSYLDTIEKKQWPAGRFTVDAGWSPFEGDGGLGDWEPRPDMDMPLIAQQIRARGHIPGIWLAPALLDRNSCAAKRNPELVGEPVQMNGECEWTKYYYLAPSGASQELINNLFRRVFDWGFRKFKLDIFYGPKPAMYELSRQCRVAADLLPEPVELEGHVPDPFCARYMDVIRLNDLMISRRHPGWRSVYEGHLAVCRNSAPGMMLNLDHIGGNCAEVGEDLFVEHLNLQQRDFEVGYPCLSLLPQHVGNDAVLAVGRFFKSKYL